MKNKPCISRTDKLCVAALVGLLMAAVAIHTALDEAAYRAAEIAEPTTPTGIYLTAQYPAVALVEAVEARKEAELPEGVPLSPELKEALLEACEANGVAPCLALGVMEVESGFRVDAVSSEGCVGLMQLNRRYFPADLSPADNIRAGVAYLGELLERYGGDEAAALTAYNAGHDTGSRRYAKAVLAASEKWGVG